MDLDSRAQYKLVSVGYSEVNFEEYRRIVDVLGSLIGRYDHKTLEMWCSRICDPFRKILEENPKILSKNGFITMYGSYMKVIVKFTVIYQIIYIVAYVTPWYLYLESIQDVLITIKITT